MFLGFLSNREELLAKRKPRRAFTLIELLIVVAIIAILAAIAVPNFLEAQARAKITRVHSDMRTIGVGVETYAVDNGRPPIGAKEISSNAVVPPEWQAIGKANARWSLLTTPISYLTVIPRDVFGYRVRADGTISSNERPYFGYNSSVWTCYLGTDTEGPLQYRLAKGAGRLWWLNSRGPSLHNRVEEDTGNNLVRALLGQPSTGTNLRHPDIYYDATNGTKSYGRLVRSNRGMEPVS